MSLATLVTLVYYIGIAAFIGTLIVFFGDALKIQPATRLFVAKLAFAGYVICVPFHLLALVSGAGSGMMLTLLIDALMIWQLRRYW